MASNTQLNAGTLGDLIVTKERTHDGDAAKQQVVALSGVSGSEGSYTFVDVAAGGGTEATALRVTLATDSTGVVSVDDNGSSLTVDGTVAATQSGTWNIGSITTLPTLAAVTTVSTVTNVATIGTSITPGTSAAHLGKAEDAAHGSGDTGVMALAVRRDADTTLADTTGDYAPLQVNASGSLKVAITSGAGSGGTSIADGASFTRDTTSVTLAAAAVETSAPTLTNGDAAALSMTTGGALRVAVASGGVAGVVEDAVASGAAEGILAVAVRDDALTTLTPADGDYTCLRVNSTGALHVTGGGGGTQYAVDAVAGAADTGTMSLAVRDDALATLTPADGDYTQLRTNARGAQWVCLDATAAQTVSIASAQTLATVTTVGTVTNITNQGNLVDDAAFTPATTRVMMAGYQADETATDSIDEGDGGAARMSLDRKQYTIAHAETGSIYQNGTARTPAFAAISGNTNGDNTLLAAQGGSNKIRVLSMYLVAAGTTTVRFESGAGGTALSGVMSLIANTGFVLPYSPVGHFETAANALLNMELNAGVQVSGGFTYIVVT